MLHLCFCGCFKHVMDVKMKTKSFTNVLEFWNKFREITGAEESSWISISEQFENLSEA